jgi:hypothetical protein
VVSQHDGSAALIDALLTDLDTPRAGFGNTMIAVTADHGGFFERCQGARRTTVRGIGNVPHRSGGKRGGPAIDRPPDFSTDTTFTVAWPAAPATDAISFSGARA